MEDNVLAICDDLLEKIPDTLNLEKIRDRWIRDDSYLKVVLL